MTKSTENKTTIVALDQKAIVGVDQYFASVGKLTIAGTDYTPASLKAVLQAEVDAENALDKSRNAVSQEVVSIRPVRASARKMRAGLRKYILGTYGTAAVQMLQDFGMTVPKTPGKKPAETTAESVVKGRATRKAREEAWKNAVPSEPAKGLLPQVSTTPTPAK